MLKNLTMSALSERMINRSVGGNLAMHLRAVQMACTSAPREEQRMEGEA